MRGGGDWRILADAVGRAVGGDAGSDDEYAPTSTAHREKEVQCLNHSTKEQFCTCDMVACSMPGSICVHTNGD